MSNRYPSLSDKIEVYERQLNGGKPVETNMANFDDLPVQPASLTPIHGKLPIITPAERAKIIRNRYLKDGSTRIIVDDFLKSLIYRVVMNGAVFEKEIFGALGISSCVWEATKKKHPIISEWVMCAEADRDGIINQFIGDILYDPTHKFHAAMLIDWNKNRHKRNARMHVTHSVAPASPADLLPDDELIDLLEEEQNEDEDE